MAFVIASLGIAPASAEDSDPVRVVVFGDSLAAGYGLLPADGFSARLQDWADENAAGSVVIENAGVSGDTTGGGLARLDWALGGTLPDALILELGANDALRGVPPSETRSNLDAMLERLTGAGVEVLLAGMLAPRNMGADYIEEFETIWPDMAAKYDIVYQPFFLEGVAGDPTLNQDDGIHPNPKGVDRLIEHIAPFMEILLERVHMKNKPASE